MRVFLERHNNKRAHLWRLMVSEKVLGGGSNHSVLIEELSIDMASAICGSHTLIFDEYLQKRGVAQQEILIGKAPDRKAGEDAWRMRIGDELVPGDYNGEARLNDEQVNILMAEANISFEAGQPDWELRRIEDAEDEAGRLRLKLEAMEKKIYRLKAERNAKTCAPEV